MRDQTPVLVVFIVLAGLLMGCPPRPEQPAAPGSGAPGPGTGQASGAGSAAATPAPGSASADPNEQFRKLYAAYEGRFVSLEQATNLAWWDASNTGKPEAFKKSAELELEVRKLRADRAVYAELSRLREGGQVTDPLLRRLLTVMYLQFKENQIDPELTRALVEEAKALEQTFNTYRANVAGAPVTANEIRRVLSESNDSAQRRAHWEASKAVGSSVAEKLRQLVRKRNEAAHSLGYQNYYEMQLELGEQDPAQIKAIFENVDQVTAGPFQELKAAMDARLAARFKIGVGELRPWHYADVFFQESPGVDGLDLDAAFQALNPQDVATRFFRGIGLPDVQEILARSDLFEKPGKVEHAFCIDIDRKGDVRVLANLKNDERWMGTLLHELGHGVYETRLDFDLPYLLRAPAHSFVTEGVAELFGTLTRNPEWLAAFTTLPPATREKLATLAREDNRQDQLIFARWSLVMVAFERALYSNPEGDLNQVWWDLVRRYQGLVPPEPLAGRQDWATKIHVVTVPAYYHNYLLGRMFAAQLKQKLMQSAPQVAVNGRFSPANRPEVGQFLVEQVFRPGLRYRWDELVQRATGEPLAAKAFVSEL